MSRETSRAPKLWYRTPVGPWSMCRHGPWKVDCSVHSTASRLRYLVLGPGRLASDGWVGRVGGLDGCVHGWVRLEVPCKADYDCGDMVGLYPPVPPPSGVCLRVSVWPLLTLAWSTHRACLLARPRGSVIQPCGRVHRGAGVWMRAGVPVTGQISPPPRPAGDRSSTYCPCTPSPLTSASVSHTCLVVGTHAAAGGRKDSRCPCCVLAPPPAAPSSSLVPLPLGNWYSATACRSRAPGSRSQGRVHVPRSMSIARTLFFLCLFCCHLFRIEYNRPLPGIVSLDKFVSPSLEHRSQSLVQHQSRPSVVSRQHHPSVCLHLQPPGLYPPLLLYFYLSASASCPARQPASQPCLDPTYLFICVWLFT